MNFKLDKKKIINDNYRHKVSLIVVSSVSLTVTTIFSILNLLTANYSLFFITLITAITSLINLIYIYNNGKLYISDTVFYITWTLSITYFIHSGAASGFSSLWAMIMPYSILIFNKKNGTRFSIFIFIILIFYFWTPYGKSFLNYAYTDDFISRFPILYLSNFILVYTYEFIRSATYTELVDTKEYYKQLMNKDELTQLPNRKLFNSKFNTLLTNPLKTQSSMMIIDIDDFKLVNDKYSHLDGDKVLRDLTQLVSNLLPNPTFFCRWGGEEFVILMEFYNKDESKLLAETIRLKIKNNTFYSLDDQVLNVTVSIGVTSFISSIIGSQKTIFSYADQALHLAKNRGKNQIVHMETK